MTNRMTHPLPDAISTQKRGPLKEGIMRSDDSAVIVQLLSARSYSHLCEKFPPSKHQKRLKIRT